MDTDTVKAESWTNLRGTRTIEAELIGVWGDQVLLRLPDGKRVSVPMDDLRGDSRIKVRKLLSTINERRDSRTNGLKRAADAAAAPAPDPIPKPPAAPEYSAPVANASLQDFLDSVHESQANGHWRVVYDALPPSSRKMVNVATKDIIESLGKDEIAALAASLQRLGSALVDKQNWLQRSPRCRGADNEPNEFIIEFVLPLAGILKEGCREEVLDLDALAGGDWESVLDKMDPAISPYCYQLMEYLQLDTPSFVIDEKGNAGTLSQEMTDVSTGRVIGVAKQEWVKSKGVWAPKDDAETFATSIENVKAKCVAGGTVSFALSAATLAIQAVADPMLSAETEDDYRVAIENHLLSPLTTVAELIIQYSGTRRTSSPSGIEVIPEDMVEQPLN